MVRYKYKKPSSKATKFVQSRHVMPKQSMTIREIVERFGRGLPVAVSQREKVFLESNDLDLEKLGRLDPTDKAFEARARQQSLDRVADKIQSERARKEQEKEIAARDKSQAKTGAGAGIDELDNTMPDDTSQAAKKLGKPGGKVS